MKVHQKELEQLFLSLVEQRTGSAEYIQDWKMVGGGDINQAAKIETDSGVWFAKWNSAISFPGMFEAESRGLQLLKKASVLYIPEVIGTGTLHNWSMLVMEFVTAGSTKTDFWVDFGEKLASLHKKSLSGFGLDHDNYIGSLPQYNDFQKKWIDFFIQQRLEKQLIMAIDKGRADKSLARLFELLYPKLSEFFPEEPPSLLHGDLWSGNFMVSPAGEACIIDPAVYFGHRLMDIAMTRLFGGFSSTFYDSYRNSWPLENNWMDAVEIANIYPLMVHVNLFGGDYLGSVKGILKRFS